MSQPESSVQPEFDRRGQRGPKPQRPLAEISEDARRAVERARAVSSKEEVVELYAQWATRYDRDVFGEMRIVGPASMARRLSTMCNVDAEVLDVGCGTGAVGSHLLASGFTAVDGLDLSREMLEVAASKGVYRRLIEGDLLQPLDLSDAVYDVVVSAGTFVSGHVGAEALDELCRISRRGGRIVFNVMEGFWEPGNFEAVVSRLVEAGTVRIVDDEREPITVDESQHARTVVLERL